MDRFNFCLGGVKRSCIHFVTPNGQIIPFDTYNLFYRDGQIDGIRARLQGGGDRMSASTGEKIFMTAAFVLIGLPPGLCSTAGMAVAVMQLGRAGGEVYAVLFGVPALIGFAIFGVLLRLLIRTWRRSPP